ncbi:hypothetical protein GY45DRAFT_879580 [Cubamyces sp. BRFM 1775]|nr:hypothetical protein GY45DRAFT_879580 [Cubamyces sp. BRFM 1775]
MPRPLTCRSPYYYYCRHRNADLFELVSPSSVRPPPLSPSPSSTKNQSNEIQAELTSPILQCCTVYASNAQSLLPPLASPTKRNDLRFRRSGDISPSSLLPRPAVAAVGISSRPECRVADGGGLPDLRGRNTDTRSPLALPRRSGRLQAPRSRPMQCWQYPILQLTARKDR